jgi:hypothetical protein
MGSKMIKGEGDDMDKVKDIGVIGQRREKTRKENPQKTSQSTKMNKGKKRPYKRVIVLCAH